VRVLTMHPGTPTFVRRAIVTFPFEFATPGQHAFSLVADPSATPGPKPRRITGRTLAAGMAGTFVTLSPGSVRIKRDGQSVVADLIAPDVADASAVLGEIIEQGEHYLWLRLLVYNAKWPRIIEVRADSLGAVAVQAHVQRLDYGDGRSQVRYYRATAAGKLSHQPAAWRRAEFVIAVKRAERPADEHPELQVLDLPGPHGVGKLVRIDLPCPLGGPRGSITNRGIVRLSVPVAWQGRQTATECQYS